MTEKQTKFKETKIGEIPEEWEVKPIGEVVEIVGGGTPSTANPKYWNEDIPWITPKDLSTLKFRYIKRGMRNITKKGIENSSAKLLPRGTVLLTTRAPVGYLAIAENEVTTNQGFRSLIPNDKTTSEFLFYLLKRNVEILKSNAGGTTFGELSGSRLKELKFPFPPLPEQRAIAKILSDLDAKIELNQQINKILEEIGRAVFKHWFVDFEFQNEEGESYKSSGGEMVYNEELEKEIPKGWRAGKLSDYFDFLEGPGIRNWQYANEGMRFINIRLIQGGDIDISSANFINQKDVDEKYQHFLLKEKDYILSTSGTLGRGAIVRKDHLPLLLNTSVIRFQPLDGKGYPFMYEYLKSDIFLNEQKILASGSVQNNFGPTHLKRMKLLLPPSEILNIFNDNMDKLYEKFTKNLEENNTLKSIRDSLLPKLVSGKIRVPLEGEE